jgi:hypothetical protein
MIRMTKSRRKRWAGHVAQMGRKEMHIRFWPEGKRPLGRARCVQEDNMRLDFRQTGWNGMD